MKLVRTRKAAHLFLAGWGVETGARSFLRPWITDRDFLARYRSILGHTLVDERRCYALLQFLRHTASLDGSVAEVGVYKGGTARLLAAECAGSTLFLFDTFAGMPEIRGGVDVHRQGEFADTSLEQVRDFVGHPERVVIRRGVFPASAVELEKERFRFVHVDCDIFDSVYACCQWFFPRLVPGGVLLFDDYAFRDCPGAKLAVDQYFSPLPEHPVLMPYGGAFVVKLPAATPAI
ncbi:MAG: TylF/MycF/NovP-related O-methyltransferase [Terriglobales bacterium]